MGPLSSFATVVGAARDFARLAGTDLTDDMRDELDKDIAELDKLIKFESCE